MAAEGFFQSAWLVDDMHEAIDGWVKAGVGPFYLMPHVQLDAFSYRGTPASLDFSVAMAQAGAMQIELIQQHDDAPSHYRDVFAPGQSGFHHVCRFADDLEAELDAYARDGVALAARGLSGDMRFAYLDTRATLGCMTEIIDDRASIRGLFDLVRASANAWDGTDPIRSVTG